MIVLQLSPLIAAALDEDLGHAGDLTSRLLPEPDRHVTARVVVRCPGVVCGEEIASAVCDACTRRLDRPVSFRWEVTETPSATGARLRQAGEVIGFLEGSVAAVLTAERTVLNFLSRTSGVATLTQRFVAAATAANPRVRIFDTRKTIPGWRALDKYAVRCGGGFNHRSGLYDAVLIKDNHLAGVPSKRLAERLREMLASLRAPTTSGIARASFIEVEVDSLDQLDAVLQVEGIDIILLDNFAPAEMRAAVRKRDAAKPGRAVELEASGGVTLETVGTIAATGVDRIAVGALTHSAPALDIGLDF